MVNNITFQIHGQTYVPIKTASGNNLLKETFINVLLLLTVALCTAMTKNDVKFCQHVSQYEEKKYMIDLGVVTPSGSISIPFVPYMGKGGGGGALQPLYWTYMYL